MDYVIQKQNYLILLITSQQERAPSSERRSFNTQFYSPSSTGYSGSATQINWMKQKFTITTDRMQDIESQSMIETPNESSRTHQQQSSRIAQSLLSKSFQNKKDKDSQTQQAAPSRPLTREEEYKLYPALKYRDYASTNSYIKFTNYRPSLATNLNKGQFNEEYSPQIQNDRIQTAPTHEQLRQKYQKQRQNKGQSGSVGMSQIFSSHSTTATGFYAKNNNGDKDNIQRKNNLNRTNSSGEDLFSITRPYFLSSRGQLNSQQKEFQTDQFNFIPDTIAPGKGQQSTLKRKKDQNFKKENSNTKQKYFISRTRFRMAEDKNINADKANATQNIQKKNQNQNKQSRSQTLNAGVKQYSGEREQILTDADIRLMMIAAGIDPLQNYLTRRANFGCKSIYNPDLLSHYERINSKNYYLSSLDPFKQIDSKYQTPKDVAEYYYHLEKFDKAGSDEYFIETREKATNYNRFHMSKPNIRMRYEQQLKIANFLILKAKQEKNNVQSKSKSPEQQQPAQDQQITQGPENSTVHGLHKYLIAKDLIKQTWKQLSQPETPNPTQIINILNKDQSKSSFTTLLKEKGLHLNSMVPISSQPESMRSISESDDQILYSKNQDQNRLEKDDNQNQFKFQQFVIDEGLQEMNHYDDIVRQYKEKLLSLNKQSKDNRENKDKIGSTEQVSRTPSPQKPQKKSAGQGQIDLKQCDLNEQQQNLPTELNIYTREDIFIKRTIDKMIANDEIDSVSLADIAQLQRIIEQRKNILKDLKDVIIKSINEILQAKSKNKKQIKQSNTLESFNLQQDTKSLQTFNVVNDQKLQVRITQSSQRIINDSTLTRISKTQQMERKKKLRKQNSLGYKDYVQSKMQKEFFGNSKKKPQISQPQTFITSQNFINEKVQKDNKQYTSSVISNEEPYDVGLSDGFDQDKAQLNENDLKQLKTDLNESQFGQSPNNLQYRRASLDSEYKNISEILDPNIKDPFFKMEYDSNQAYNIQNRYLGQQQQQQGSDLVIDEDEDEQNIESESKLDLKQQQSLKKTSESYSNFQIQSLESYASVDDQAFNLEIKGKNMSSQSQKQENQLPSLNIFKQESSQSNKSQELQNITLNSKKSKSKGKKISQIQPLKEEHEENESPNSSLVNFEQNEVSQTESQPAFKSQNFIDQAPTLSKFNPNHSQRDSINLPAPISLNYEASSIQQVPSITIADSFANFKQTSLGDSINKLSQIDKDFDNSSLSQLESKKQNEIKLSQQNLMNALKQADIVQRSNPQLPSLLELPNKQKSYVTYSLINEQLPQPSPMKPSLTSRSNLDSPQLSPQPDSQRSVLSKTEFEKEKLQSLMQHQQRLNRQQTIKSNVRVHSDVTKNNNLASQKAALVAQFNSAQEFNYAETQAINARNVKITEYFEKADKVIATKATLNKPEGYNPFLNEEEAEQIIEKLNRSRNSNASMDTVPQIQLHHVQDSVNTEEDYQQESILAGKLSAREDKFDASMQIEEEDNEEDDPYNNYLKDDIIAESNEENINSERKLNEDRLKRQQGSDQQQFNINEIKTEQENENLQQSSSNQIEIPVNTKHQVRFEIEDEKQVEKEEIRQKKKSEIESALNYSQEQSLGIELESSVAISESRLLSNSAISRQVSTTNIKDEVKLKKKVDSKLKMKKKANIINSMVNSSESKKADNTTLKQSTSITTPIENISQFQSRQPSLAYLDDNMTKTISQHNISDIQKLVSDKFKNKKSMVQGFSGASLYKIVTESFVELEEQMNIMKEEGSNIFQTKKSLSNIKSNQKLIKTKSFKNLSTKNVFKQNAINDILNEYKINDKMDLLQKRRVIEKLVNRLEAKADIEEDQNFNSLLYKQVQTELKYISQSENDTNQQILQQKQPLQQELSLLEKFTEPKKKDFVRGRLKFSDNIILNQKNNLLEEVNEEDLVMDHDLMDVIQRLVKQNEDQDEEIQRKKIFKQQTTMIQRTLQKNQRLAPIIDDFKQLGLQKDQIEKQKRKRKTKDNVHLFKRQATKFYGNSDKLSKEEIEMLKKMEKLKEKFNLALEKMSKEEKINLRDQYLHVKQRAESR